MNIRHHLTLAASALSLPAAMAQTHDKPNVIVVLADDLGFGDVSAYGSKSIHTPNIDSLAHGGVCFTNAYACSATSTPSRYALMTGMYPWRNEDAKILPGDAPLIFRDNEFTLPKMMQQAGYATGAVGKWHLGMGRGNIDWNKTVKPGARETGFDYSCIIAATNDRVPTVYVENGDVVGLDPNDPIEVDYERNFEGEPTALSHPEMLKMMWAHGHNNSIVNGIPRIGFMKGGKDACWRDEDMADYLVDKVKKFITAHRDSAFFLYYGLHQPHVPRAPHERFAGATPLGPRGDAIVEADWCVGELMSHLKKEGILDNTIVIFSSDNGPVLQDGYIDYADSLAPAHGHSPSGGLRGGKYSLFDGGTHIPLFVYWHGKILPKKSDELVCQLDLTPSLARLSGGMYPEGLDGLDNMDALMGNGPSARENIVLEAQGRLAYRQGDWVIIPPYQGRRCNETGNELGNMGEYGLFNVKNDPSQQHNLADSEPELLELLKYEFINRINGTKIGDGTIKMLTAAPNKNDNCNVK